MTEVRGYLIGWRASRDGRVIAFGRDVFHRTSEDRAMKAALVWIPRMIFEPGCSVRIRYTRGL